MSIKYYFLLVFTSFLAQVIFLQQGKCFTFVKINFMALKNSIVNTYFFTFLTYQLKNKPLLKVIKIS
ncbi:MAG TPA: hypothetical protein DDZ41_07515 [Flavobacterium sp.]|nr:hypothetical protein [Flavobacterium sp.]